MLEIERRIDTIEGVRDGNVQVRIEGCVKEERPEGIRPNSIFVIFSSQSVEFQFSILKFHHNGTHYLPAKSGNRGSSYKLTVDKSELPSAAFEEPEIGQDSLAELSDEHICGILYPVIFHEAVIPTYNEWRYRNDLEWGGTWGSSSGNTKYDYRPYSIR